jgi:hypothetical protein
MDKKDNFTWQKLMNKDLLFGVEVHQRVPGGTKDSRLSGSRRRQGAQRLGPQRVDSDSRRRGSGLTQSFFDSSFCGRDIVFLSIVVVIKVFRRPVALSGCTGRRRLHELCLLLNLILVLI